MRGVRSLLYRQRSRGREHTTAAVRRPFRSVDIHRRPSHLSLLIGHPAANVRRSALPSQRAGRWWRIKGVRATQLTPRLRAYPRVSFSHVRGGLLSSYCRSRSVPRVVHSRLTFGVKTTRATFFKLLQYNIKEVKISVPCRDVTIESNIVLKKKLLVEIHELGVVAVQNEGEVLRIETMDQGSTKLEICQKNTGEGQGTPRLLTCNDLTFR